MPEPKTIRHWISKAYQFVSLSNCPACGAPTETWSKGNQQILLDKQTMETHFSSCSRAQAYRQEMKAQAGVL